jgi:hypothetical protein
MKSFVIKSNQEEDPVEYVIPAYKDVNQVLEHFTLFLKACGYEFDGCCDIIDYDDGK